MVETPATLEAREASRAPRRPLPGRLPVVLAVGVAAIVALIDQATKVVAVEELTEHQPVDTPVPLLQWVLLYNENAAFGIPGFTGMFLLVTLAVLALVARMLPRTQRLSLALAYGLVSGGAIGNGIDRMVREPGFPDGGVVDFISVGWWPVFNVADSAIVVGAALIGLLLLRDDGDLRAEDREASGLPRERATADASVRPEPLPPQGPAAEHDAADAGRDAVDAGRDAAHAADDAHHATRSADAADDAHHATRSAVEDP